MIARLGRLVDRRAPLVLAALILVAFAARLALAAGNETPWIFGDEFIYSELARSLADRGELAVRGVSPYYSALVPLLHAPGYLLGDTDEAYGWIKAMNALVMVGAAAPAYGLARLALSRRLSLVAAVLVLAWPAYAYVGVVMTEPLFFLAVMTLAWALARALVRPTRGCQALVVGALVAALLVRLQAAVFIVSIPAAALTAAALGAAGGRGATAALGRLRAHAPLIVATVALPLLAIGLQLARGRPLDGLLGGYGEAGGTTSAAAAWDWSVWHVATIALSVGVVPLALAVAVWGRVLRRRLADTGAGAVAVATLAISLPLVVQVALFAAEYAGRVQERNLFAVEPLLVIAALVGLAGLGFSRVAAVATALVAALAIADLPVAGLLAPQPPLSDTFTLLALLRVGADIGMAPPALALLVAMAGVALTAAAVLVRRRPVLAVFPVALLGLLVVANARVTPLLNDYSAAVAAATVPEPRDWIDRAAGDERVALLWSSADDPKLVWEAEFWNASVDTVVAVPGPMPAELGASRAAIDPATGRFVPPPGFALPTEPLAVAPDAWELVGTPVARAATAFSGMTLWRLDGPPRLRTITSGLYGDGWTGPVLEVVRHDCRGGTFLLPVRPGFGARRALTLESGERRRRVTLGPGRTVVRTPARPDAGGACRLTVRPERTATGAELGNPADPRVLGVLAEPPGFAA